MNDTDPSVTIAGAFVSPLGREHDQVIGFGADGWFVAPAHQAIGEQEWLPVAAAELLDLVQARGETMVDRDGQAVPASFSMPRAAAWARGDTSPAQICTAALRQILRHDPTGVCGGIAAMALMGAGEPIGPL